MTSVFFGQHRLVALAFVIAKQVLMDGRREVFISGSGENQRRPALVSVLISECLCAEAGDDQV